MVKTVKDIKFIVPIKTSLVSLPHSFASSPTEEYDLTVLKNSIAENGILFPLTVREISKGRYEAVCGKRRLMCAKILGLKTVPCIKITADSTSARFLAISDTVCRKNPDFFSLGAELSDLIVNSGFDFETLRYRLGITEDYLNLKLDLIKLPDAMKSRICAANLSEKQASLLLKINPEKRADALDYIIANALGEKETEEYINSVLSPKKEPPKPVRKSAIGDLKLFSNSLSKMLNTLSFSGFEPTLSTDETETLKIYTISVRKKAQTNEYYQLPLC